MARYLIDLFKTRDPFTGLGQFAQNLAEALMAEARPDEHLTFLVPKGYANPALRDRARVEARGLFRYLPGLHNRYDLWHSVNQFASHPPKPGAKNILTVHDLNFLVEKTPAKAARYMRKLQREVDRATAIVAISDYTRNLLEKHIDLHGKRLEVIHNGVKLEAFPQAPAPSFVREGKFFLCVSVFKEKKNLHSLLPLLKHFPEHQLILVGQNGTAYGDSIRRAVVEQRLADRVVLPSTVDDATKHWLYVHCDAFLFPSLAEGFGMPVIEAMRAGVPVIASRCASIPEIAGDHAAYFTHFDPVGMARTIQDHLSAFCTEGDMRRERSIRHAERFDWGRCARTYLQLYRQVVAV